MPSSSNKPSPSGSRSAVKSGIFTGVAALVVSSSAVIAGALLTQKFGRNSLTDGFLAAYGVYLVLVLAAQAFRLVIVPDLTRAEAEGSLPGEFRAYAVTFALLAIPVCVFVGLLRHPLGNLLTGSEGPVASHIAARALVLLVPAAFGQLFAALAASALAAKGSYQAAAIGYALGGIAGLVVFAVFANEHGIVALAWGLTLNAAIAVGIPLVRLGQLGGLRAGGIVEFAVLRRLWRLLEGAALPIVIQGLYIVALRFAADLAVGDPTSLSYAYLLAATFVTVTASPLSLISSAPLTRRGLDAARAAHHVVMSAWISLAIVAAAAGTFALVGGTLASVVLGDAFAGDVGHELGRLVVWFSPWMVAAIVFSLTFPLAFVMGKTRALIPLAILILPVHFGISYGLRAAFGLGGVVLALAVSTVLVDAALMWMLAPEMLRRSARGLVRPTVIEAGSAIVCFAAGYELLGRWAGALAGFGVYVAILWLTRRLGLADAWHYVRHLHAPAPEPL